MDREIAGHGFILQDGNVGRHLQRAASAKLANHVDDGGIILDTPVQSRIHHAPVERDESRRRPFLGGLNLPATVASISASSAASLPRVSRTAGT